MERPLLKILNYLYGGPSIQLNVVQQQKQQHITGDLFSIILVS
jgi:hypothetical protein